jgi:ABC-type bacteriocin/lantibiotic exporter with double-glycine peptidase domain
VEKEFSVSKYEPEALTSRFVDACISIAFGIFVLYVAVCWLTQIWLWVVGIAALLVAGRLAWWWRQRRW